MKKLHKILVAAGIIGTCTLAAMGGVYGFNYYVDQKEAKAAAAEIRRRESIVGSYKDIAYGNKKLAGVDLSGMTVDEITDGLKLESKVYQDRKVKLNIDGREYSYSMKKLGENIYYKTSDGLKFQLGEEEEIANIIVNMDKDRDMQEQYDIITGNGTASDYSIEIECKYNKKKLDKLIAKLDENHVKPAINSHIDKSGNIS